MGFSAWSIFFPLALQRGFSLQDIMSNPGNIAKYQNDPDVMNLINKVGSAGSHTHTHINNRDSKNQCDKDLYADVQKVLLYIYIYIYIHTTCGLRWHNISS